MNERQRIADRVRRMLEKATAESSTEAEAAAFAEKAQQLILEHALSLTEVHNTGEPEDEDAEIDSELETDPRPWRRRLGMACAALYMCKYFFTLSVRDNGRTKYDVHSFIGKRSRIIIAKMMFVYLCTTVDRLAREGAHKLPEKQRSPYRVAFRTAASMRLGNRMGRRIADAKRGGVLTYESGAKLPALLNEYDAAEAEADAVIERQVGELVVIKNRGNPLDLHPLGAAEGARAGEAIGLDQQVGTDKTKRINQHGRS